MVAKKLLVRKIVIYFSFAFCQLKGDRSHVLWLSGSWPFQLLILKGNHFQWIFAQWLKKCKVQEEFSFFFENGGCGKKMARHPLPLYRGKSPAGEEWCKPQLPVLHNKPSILWQLLSSDPSVNQSVKFYFQLTGSRRDKGNFECMSNTMVHPFTTTRARFLKGRLALIQDENFVPLFVIYFPMYC